MLGAIGLAKRSGVKLVTAEESGTPKQLVP
jgi:hypothetical protein